MLALLGCLLGCDDGARERGQRTGPPLRVVSTYPEDGAGFDCAISDFECGIPIDTSIEIRFDRYLLPSTAVRQSMSIYSGDQANAVPSFFDPALTPRYDVVERVVSYELPTGVLLQPNTHYTVELVVPEAEQDFGFRAFDFAPLDENTTVRLSFLTSNLRKTRLAADPEGTCFNTEVTLNGHCSSAGCHTSETADGRPTDPVMGLDLSDANGFIRTAIGRVAHQTETGTQTGRDLQNPERFGVAMPRIDPGRPDNSYLMYKLLLSPENYRRGIDDLDECGTSHLAPVDPTSCALAAPEENDRLRAWFLRGTGMPRTVVFETEPGVFVAEEEPRWLVRRELRRLESWIRAGSPCP